MTVLRLAYNPTRLDAKNSRIIENWLELVKARQQLAVNAMVEMVTDLHQNGYKSRFIKSLKGLPLLELKTTSRGGEKGGSRIYFFFTEGEAFICNCEVKKDDEASETVLGEALAMLKAYSNGQTIWKG
jgi:hypothetical protein